VSVEGVLGQRGPHDHEKVTVSTVSTEKVHLEKLMGSLLVKKSPSFNGM
jgi:hypothetical protein